MWLFVPFMALFASPIDLDLAHQAERAGDYARMLAAAREAFANCPDDPPCRAQALNLAAGAHYYRGEYREARETYGRTLALYRQLGDRAQQGFLLNNLGSLSFVEGRYPDALRSYEEALALKAGPTVEELTWANQASLYQKLGRDEAALQLYRKLDTHRATLSLAEYGRVQANLGALLRRLGDPIKARATYLKAISLFAEDRNLDGELGALKNLAILEAQDLNEPASARQRFDLVLAKAEKSGNRREAAQARLYLAELKFRQKDIAGAVTLWGQVLTAGLAEESWRAEYGLGRAAAENGEPRKARELWQRAVARIEEMRTTLRASVVRADFLAARQAPYEAMLDAVTADPEPNLDEVLGWMERARARALGESFDANKLSIAALQARLDSSTALLLFRGSRVLWIRSKDAGWSSWPEEALNSAQTWIIVPDAERLKKPLDADAGVVEQHVLWHLPAARFLLADTVRSGFSLPWDLQLRVLAAPTAAKDAGRLPGDDRWGYLPSAVDEAEWISARLAGRTEIFTGREATRARVTSAPVLHLATHATADLEDPARSRILLSAGERYDYLFRPEIARLPLHGTALVVLSACETERGRDLPGEGPQSLARAFLEAGASSTVATMWKVDDAVSAEFMRQFYGGLGRGLAKGEALRAAKMAFVRSGSALSDPKHWGAFVLTGAGNDPLPAVLGWPELLFGTGLLLLIGFGLAYGLSDSPKAQQPGAY